MKGARSAQSRPYWIRYVVAFWAVEKLTWAKDNVLIACVCSLAPGLIAAGISAAISDQKWRAVTYATLLTYGGLFALFLMWRLAYELASVLHGNSSRADFVDDIQDWGLVTEKKPIGVGTTFHYTVVRLTKLAHQLEERGVPVEGWIHFSVTGVHEKEIGATIYRLIVLTPNGGITADIAGTKNLAGLAGSQFQKIPDASHVLHD